MVIPKVHRLSLWDNWGEERGCDEGHWHAHTRGLPWGLPEVVGMVQVHCNWRKLLRWGLEFHACTINKSARKKKVWKLIYGPHIYIYMFVTRIIGPVFGNDPGDRGSIPGRVTPKTLKMVLDTSLRKTLQYKVHMKGKVEQFREMSSALPYTSVK